MLRSKLFSLLTTAVAITVAFGHQIFAAQAPNLIHSAIDEGHMVTVGHSKHPAARSEADLGMAPDNLAMDRMLLVLKRSAAQQVALNKFLEELQQPGSPNYRKFLTPEEFGAQFGASEADIQIATAWLQNHGFKVEPVPAGRSVIEFSGNAGQVRSAFRTEIHKFRVGGTDRWANASEQQLPAALASAVAGVSTLHNMTAAPQSSIVERNVAVTNGPTPQYTSGSGNHYLSPGDYATIYNVTPLYPTITGAGTVIAVVGRTNINVADVTAFRSLMGLPANAPNVILNGTNPGDLGGGEEAEAVLDTTWAGALATGATVDLVVSASTATTDGADLSELYIINHNLANVMTESFGSCEASYTAAQAALLSSNAQQAAAQGITYVVSAGDAGSAGCDDFNTETSATGAISVNALASSPYTLAVGGTQFFENGSTQYWNTSNATGYKSALSYIPENVWNANCTGATCGTGSILAGGGGSSKFFTKPSWQSGVAGIPADGARDLPDVSLTAAGHDAYLLCLAGSCNSTTPSIVAIYGTSASAPAFASIAALVSQKAGARLGQMAPRLYALAATQTLASCNASNTAALPASSCIFNDVTVGTNAVPGEANYNTASATYLAGVGYDLASGLGSVNVANLVNNWTAVVTSPTAAVSPSSLTFAGQNTGTTSAAQTVTLSNTGSAALTIAGIALNGTNASDFATSTTCGATLATGSSCTVSVTFKPSALGTRTANLVITDNTGNVSGSTQTVSLSGTGSSTGTPTSFTAYLGTYGSGQQTYSGSPVVLPLRAYYPGGASQIASLTTNLVASTGAEFSVVVVGDGAGNYALSLQNGVTSVPWPLLQLASTGNTVTLSTPISLGGLSITAYRFALAGGELQLDLTVSRTGTFSDQIVIYAIQGNNAAYSSPWGGVDGQWSNTGTSAPGITLSPASLTFGSQTVGASVKQTITVTNSGSAALAITSAQVSGTNAGDFIVANGCPASVAASGTCSISVTFTPLAGGTRTATLSIADNVTGSPQTVPLSGTGSSTGTPTSFTAYLGTYGSGQQTYSGSPVVLPLRAYYPGGASQITSLTTNLVASTGAEFSVVVVGDGAGNYALSLQNGVTSVPWPLLQLASTGTTVTLSTPISLGGLSITAYRFALAGGELQLDLTVSRTGTFSDQIVIYAIQGNNAAYSSPWGGVDGQWSNTGTSAPGITLSPASLTFGSQTVGASVKQTITVTNSGSAALAITSAQVSGTNAGDFVVANGCPASVAASGTCSISVTFTPLAAGTRTATLSIADNVTGSPQTVPLSGTGSSTGTPTSFTAYLGTYGSGQQTYHGSPVVLPLRAFYPGGASQIASFVTNLNSSTGTEFSVVVVGDGAGNYALSVQNGVTSVPWPLLPLTASGATVTLSTPISLGGLSITAYRFALAGSELQLDLSVSRASTFSDQIVIYAVQGNNASYSLPWLGVDGSWSNP